MSVPYVRADEVLRALHAKHTKKIQRPDSFFTQVRNGKTQGVERGRLRIIDGLAVRKSWTQPCLIGYEVKVNRSDFTSDTKWTDYLPLCHELYFACPSGLIQPEEVGEEVGLVWYNPETKSLTTRKKAVYRRIELSAEMLYHILMSHCDDGGHPFFSRKREMLEAWLEDKRARRDMGYAVEGKLWGQLADQEREIGKLQKKVRETFDLPQKRLDEIRDAMREAGIDVDGWGWQFRLKEILSDGVTAEISRQVDDVIKAANMLKRTVERTYAQGGKESASR